MLAIKGLSRKLFNFIPLVPPKFFPRICRGTTFEQFPTVSSLATWDDQSRMISRQNYPKRTHILPIPSKPYSVYSVHPAIGSRMNGIAFPSFRKRNKSQKNAIAVYSKYSYSGIVPNECTPYSKVMCESSKSRRLDSSRLESLRLVSLKVDSTFWESGRERLCVEHSKVM